MNGKATAAPDGERIRSAAYRLKHDLAKPIRWNAPAEREAGLEELRARLRLDVGSTRVRDGRTSGAVAIFEQWSQEESQFLSAAEFAPDLAALAALVKKVRSLIVRIDTLDRGGLVELDEASRQIADRCVALSRLAVAVAVAVGARA
jgi:hypothetical protein